MPGRSLWPIDLRMPFLARDDFKIKHRTLSVGANGPNKYVIVQTIVA